MHTQLRKLVCCLLTGPALGFVMGSTQRAYAQDGPIGSQSWPLVGEEIPGKPGVVQINGGCGGIILDERHVLTAGHCFVGALGPLPTNPEPICERDYECPVQSQFCSEGYIERCTDVPGIAATLEGDVDIFVDYFAPGSNTPRRISNVGGTELMHVSIYPEYDVFPGTTLVIPNTDLAIIRRDSGPWIDSWSGLPLAATDTANIRTTGCSDLDGVTFYSGGPVNDAGDGSGILRTMNVDLLRCDQKVFTFGAASGRAICKGDSGSPYMIHSGGIPMLVGIQSLAGGIDSPDICQESGEGVTAVHIDSQHIGWITSVLGKSCNGVMLADSKHAAINCFM